MATDTDARNAVDALAARVDGLADRLNALSAAVGRLTDPPPNWADAQRRREESSIARRRRDAEAGGSSLQTWLLHEQGGFLEKMSAWAFEVGSREFFSTTYLLVSPELFDLYELQLSPISRLRSAKHNLSLDTLHWRQWILVRNTFNEVAKWVRGQ